ncbi:hypothetical protein AALO_G00277930, partial [Alosa alosa]
MHGLMAPLPRVTTSAPAASSMARSASRARRVERICAARTRPTVILIATPHTASTFPPNCPMSTSTSSNIPSGIRQRLHHVTVVAHGQKTEASATW